MTIFGATTGKMVQLEQRNRYVGAVLETPADASQRRYPMTTPQSTRTFPTSQLTADDLARFWSQVDRSRGSGACWPWLGGLTHDGYGRIGLCGTSYLAHRVAYEVMIAPIPTGLQLDHVKARGCTSRACCNPAHVEPVTARTNSLRGESFVAVNAAKTHCVRGHEFSPENTRLHFYSDSTKRICRECDRIRQREYKVRKGGPA